MQKNKQGGKSARFYLHGESLSFLATRTSLAVEEED